MTLIPIDEYNRSEQAALTSASNRYREAFAPSHFSSFGYPSRVVDENELYNFVDVMQERRFDYYFDSVLGALTEEEFEKYRFLSSAVAELCKKRFGKPGCGKSAIAHSINVLRHIQFVTNNQSARVFEIGPGCGYLGALLTGSNYRYMSYDVTQAFYLYQNRLLSHLYGSRLVEVATGGLSGKHIEHLLSGEAGFLPAIHLPWWEAMRLPQGHIPTVDIVTCNHVLCEMHYMSLSFMAKLCRLMLEGSSGPRLVVFEGWGWHATNRLSTVVGELYRHGFVLAHQDPHISVLALRADVNAGQFPEVGAAVDTHGINWSAGKCFVEEGVKPFDGPAIGRKLAESRERLRSRQTVSKEIVRNHLVSLVGENGLTTEDEHFLNFIEHP
ncbi:MAG: hypothetical protein U0136_15150 [Bdellovibrionota bacterium]